ncbi:anti-sigma factor domain-containing protein [Hymenobacter sp. B81]|uniref:anti-sigma factor n=1 Tax=Hymenobacter sp. B81 TaxID=3344878 RepID=UPI0037DDA8A9
MNIQDYIESGQLELYVLQQLAPAEQAEVEQLAAQHPAVRAELERIEQALNGYAAAHAQQPPAGMRERVLAGWQQAIRAAGPQASAAPLSEQTTPPSAPEAVVRPMPAPAADEQPAGSGRWYRWLAAAAVALLVFSAGANLVLYNRWRDAETNLLAVRNDQARVAATMQVMEKKLGHRTQELAVLRSEEFRPVVLRGVAAAPGARARVLYNPGSHAVYLDVHNLPAPPAGKQYQLWALDKGQPVDAGLLTTATAAGDSLQRMKDVASAQAFAVTLEPAGGLPAPTLAALTVMGQI